MAASLAGLDNTLIALADPTRRAILEMLSRCDARVTDVAAPFSISLNSVSKHIRLLERAGLVRRRIHGREHTLSLDPRPLDQAAQWMVTHRSLWQGRLIALDQLLKDEDRMNGRPSQETRARMMTRSDNPVIVRVTHRFDATAERVYDAFLDPAKASRFLFATATGEIVRCDIEARVGGRFTITDRRYDEDVVHTGMYEELDRPRRIVFTFSVEKYSNDVSRVTVEIAPRHPGCDVTVTHEMKADSAPYRERTEQGWTAILDVAATVVVDDAPTCGVGVAQHAAIVASAGAMFEGLADMLSLHRQMLRGDDAATRQEDDVYRDLAQRWSRVATQVQEAAAFMAAQRDLPRANHDESAWGEAHLRAFEEFVTAQSHLLALLRVAVPRDEQMLASMRDPTQR